MDVGNAASERRLVLRQPSLFSSSLSKEDDARNAGPAARTDAGDSSLFQQPAALVVVVVALF